MGERQRSVSNELKSFLHRVEETGRIGWSPIATDRRPNGRQNILRSAVLTISSIKLSSSGAGRGRDAGARKIANLLNAPAVIPREKLCICISVSRGGGGARGSAQISAYKPITTSPRFRPTTEDASRAVRVSLTPSPMNVLLLLPIFQASPSPPPDTLLVPWIFIASQRYLRLCSAPFATRAFAMRPMENRISNYGQRTDREELRLEERPVKELLHPRGFVINLARQGGEEEGTSNPGLGKMDGTRWWKRRTRTI